MSFTCMVRDTLQARYSRSVSPYVREQHTIKRTPSICHPETHWVAL